MVTCSDDKAGNVNREEQLDQVMAEYIRRVDAGERVDREQFLNANPDVRDELD